MKNTKTVSAFRKRCFWVILLLLPILLLSGIDPGFIGINKQSPYLVFIVFSFSSMIYIYGGWPFLKGLILEVRTKKPGMMFTIGITITIAYIYSIAIIFGLQKIDFFRELIALILIMILDYWIELRSISKVSKEVDPINQTTPLEKKQEVQAAALLD